MEKIKKTWLWVFIMALYKLTIYPYLETNKYYEELINDVFENDIPRILRKMGYDETYNNSKLSPPGAHCEEA